jgi:hypothetical protein
VKVKLSIFGVDDDLTLFLVRSILLLLYNPLNSSLSAFGATD